MIDDFEAVIKKMEETHRQLPSLRFCQILGNVVGDHIYYFHNDDLLIALNEYLERETG